MQLTDWKTAAAAQGTRTTTTGHVKVIEGFPIPQLNRKRRIWVYLPPQYEETNERYPVLYMHDGQNLFDEVTSYVGEWQVDKTLDHLFFKRKTPGLIVVGVDNGSEKRFEEYIPLQKGKKYASFIADTLKPYIDQRFRTLSGREHTGVAGSSLGGLISLYIGLSHPDKFSKIAAFSPAMKFAGEAFAGFGPMEDMKIYMDVGTRETLTYMDAKQYADAVWDTYYDLIHTGFGAGQIKLVVEKDAPHQEDAWARRFPAAVLWLYGLKNANNS